MNQICTLKMAGSVFCLRLKGSLGNHFLMLTFVLKWSFWTKYIFSIFLLHEHSIYLIKNYDNPLHVSCFSWFIWNKLKLTFHSTNVPENGSMTLPSPCSLQLLVCLEFHHVGERPGPRGPPEDTSPCTMLSAWREPSFDKPPRPSQVVSLKIILSDTRRYHLK